MVASTVKKGKDLLRKGNRHHLPCGFYILGLSASVTKSHRVAQNVPYIQLPLFKCYQLKVQSLVCLKCIAWYRGSAQKLADQILVPLKKAETVLDFTYCGESSTRLVEALRNLGLPELNKSVMLARSADSVPYIKPESYEFAHSLVATLESPHSLILVLKEKLEMDLSSFDEKLTFSDAIGILEYFSRNIESLETVDQETLRKLPFYPTATGNLAKIKDRNVFLLPGIPKEEMNVVESRLHCLFLDPLASLSKIFEFLQLQPLPPVEVYLKFVLKCFKHLSVKGKLAHLRYLRQLILFPETTGSKGEERDNRRLLDCLTTVEFIPSIGGIMKTASNFLSSFYKIICMNNFILPFTLN